MAALTDRQRRRALDMEHGRLLRVVEVRWDQMHKARRLYGSGSFEWTAARGDLLDAWAQVRENRHAWRSA